ncbi:MAG TPA: phytanoyl-CoA dioxygenase family protein, partial [Microlunatus sp.]|nr:phytanoyl-CoA dioxygenase family protein [Microlunatus sp.]
SQVNVVNPGGRAQSGHRDYHLGFSSAARAERYPAAVHRLSPRLTLQGAVAHCDMPVVTGPTMYLPHSQKYPAGYVAFHRPDFTAYFDAHFVQLPLRKGDAAFFNPALFHGAGNNVSADVQRMANLLQVSSAFGRAMEAVDRGKVSRAIFPVLKARRDAGVDATSLADALACAAEGYPFPSNLDLDANVDGLTPLSQAQVVQNALAEGWSSERLDGVLTAYDTRHATDEI